MTRYPGLLEIMQRYPDEEAAKRHVRAVRIKLDPTECSACRLHHVALVSDAQSVLVCRECGKEVPETHGTLMEDSSLGLHTWIFAAHLLEAHRDLRPLDMARMLGLRPSDAYPLVRKLEVAHDDSGHRRLLALPPRG